MNQVLFRNWLCNVHLGEYSNGRLALRLTEGTSNDPIATCTINEPRIRYWQTKDNWVLIKNYSENKGMYKALLDAEIVEPMMEMTQENFAALVNYKGKFVMGFYTKASRTNFDVILCKVPTSVFNTLKRKEGV